MSARLDLLVTDDQCRALLAASGWTELDDLSGSRWLIASTAVHEAGHAVAAIKLGGRFDRIEMNANDATLARVRAVSLPTSVFWINHAAGEIAANMFSDDPGWWDEDTLWDWLGDFVPEHYDDPDSDCTRFLSHVPKRANHDPEHDDFDFDWYAALRMWLEAEQFVLPLRGDIEKVARLVLSTNADVSYGAVLEALA